MVYRTEADTPIQQPYLLPSIASSSFSVVAVIMCALFIEEVRFTFSQHAYRVLLRVLTVDSSQTLPSKVAAKKAAAEQKQLDVSPSPILYGSTTPSTSASTRVPSPIASTPPSTPGTPVNLIDSGEPILKADPPGSSIFTLLSKPHIRAVLMSGFMFSFLGVGFQVVFVLYSYTRVDLGGIGRSVR